MFNRYRVLEVLWSLTSYHRVQGSPELVRAVNYLQGVLEKLNRDLGNLLEIRRLKFKYDGLSEYLTLRSPTPWRLRKGELILKSLSNEEIVRLTTDDHPLLAVTGSPPGEAKAPVRWIASEEDWMEFKEGEVALITYDLKDAYRRALEYKPSGVILLNPNSRGFPYVGLFLTRKELRDNLPPAMSLPGQLYEVLKGTDLRAELNLETDLNGEEELPVLVVRVGREPWIAFGAHICHPKPGANDNASGSVLTLELLHYVLETKIYERLPFGFAFLWFPEHYGSMALMSSELGEELAEGVLLYLNLDMVGTDLSEGNLFLVEPPLGTISGLYNLLREVFMRVTGYRELFGNSTPVRSKLSLYARGSDHDVFSSLGIPSASFISWPDKYYHSSYDDLSSLSLDTLELVYNVIVSFLRELTNSHERGDLKNQLSFREEIEVLRLRVIGGSEGILSPIVNRKMGEGNFKKSFKGYLDIKRSFLIPEESRGELLSLYDGIVKEVLQELLNMIDFLPRDVKALEKALNLILNYRLAYGPDISSRNLKDIKDRALAIVDKLMEIGLIL